MAAIVKFNEMLDRRICGAVVVICNDFSFIRLQNDCGVQAGSNHLLKRYWNSESLCGGRHGYQQMNRPRGIPLTIPGNGDAEIAERVLEERIAVRCAIEVCAAWIHDHSDPGERGRTYRSTYRQNLKTWRSGMPALVKTRLRFTTGDAGSAVSRSARGSREQNNESNDDRDVP